MDGGGGRGGGEGGVGWSIIKYKSRKLRGGRRSTSRFPTLCNVTT